MTNEYHKYVIADGEFVGEFERMYSECDDPWNQSSEKMRNSTRNSLVILHCERLQKQFSSRRVLELGCGFGFLTSTLSNLGFTSMGTDISTNAILRANEIHLNATFTVATFDNVSILNDFQPDIILMPEITWYVLDELDDFLKKLKSYAMDIKKPVFLIHLLATYAPGAQKFGTSKFTNYDEILEYFDLNYLESGYIRTHLDDGSRSEGTFFVAQL